MGGIQSTQGGRKHSAAQDAQARQWLGEQVGARGLDAHALDIGVPDSKPTNASAKSSISLPNFYSRASKDKLLGAG
jgi:hypothetical protein